MLLVVMKHWGCAAPRSRQTELGEGDGRRQWQRALAQVSGVLLEW
jgi:hypothetical protein